MRLLVIGAAGRSGRLVTARAVAAGHAVTALGREGRNLPEGAAPIHGDATERATLRRAVGGQDAVIMAVGSSPIVLSLLPEMAEAGVARIVMTSSRSVVATKPALAVTLAWLTFRSQYADLARAEGMLQASSTAWTIARATMLADGTQGEGAHVDFEANATGGSWKLDRHVYARVLLDLVADPSSIRKAVGIGNSRLVRVGVCPAPVTIATCSAEQRPPAMADLNSLNEPYRRYLASVVLFHVAAAEEVGLGATDYQASNILELDGPLTSGQLAERLALTTGATTRLVDRLVEAGIARRIADTDDRRRVVVEHTGRLPDRLNEVLQSVRPPIQSALEALSARELHGVERYISEAARAYTTAAQNLRTRNR